MKKMLDKLLIVSFSLILSGCISWQANLSIPLEEGWDLVSLKDERPDIEKKGGGGYLISSCGYGIQRLGDVDTVPSRIDLLKSMLVREFSDSIAGEKIVLKHYSIVYNRAASSRGVMDKTSPGLVNSILNYPECPVSKNNGLYEAEELEEPFDPFVIYIEISVKGTLYSSRSVITFGKELMPVRHTLWDSYVEKAMLISLEGLMTQIKKSAHK